MDISALILAKNEENMIGDCIKQLDFVKEIIILDQNSRDKTIEIANKYNVEILNSSEENFSKNRNLLLSRAKSKWILYIDCDERLSKDNIDEIKTVLSNITYSAYYFPRKNIILGKWLKHGGWWPDYVPKLFLKKKLIKWQGKVHESPIVEGKYGYMKEPLTHYTARSIGSMLEKTIKWAKIEAQLSYEANQPNVNIIKIVKAVILEFSKRYFVKLGILDGTIGLIEAIFQSLHKAAILTYLWEFQNKK